MAKAQATAAESALNAAREQARQIRNANLTPLQVARNKILDRQADARFQQTDSSIPAAWRQWIADVSTLTIAAKQTAFNTIADQLNKLKSAITDSGGHATAGQKADWLKQLEGLNAQIEQFIKGNPFFASYAKDAASQVDGISKSIGQLTEATSLYSQELQRLQKSHTRAMLRNNLDAGLMDYRDRLTGEIDPATGKPMTPDQINNLVNQQRANRIEEIKTSYLNDFNSRAGQSLALTDWGAKAAQLKQNFLNQGFTDADISQFLGKEKWLYMFDQLKGMFNTAFSAIYTDGFGGFFHSIESGISQMLNNLASQILSSYATKLIMNLIGMGSGGVATGGGGVSPYGGLISAVAGSIFPSHATGLDRVPYDNYVANLHKGEAVLTAQEAQAWRNMTTGAGMSGGAIAMSGGGTSTVINNYYSIGTMQANNPQEFTKKIAGQKVSRSQMSREALRFVSKGRGSS